MAIETLDLGDYVECDGCSKVYRTADRTVDLPDQGGLLFGSKAYCPLPDCAPKMERLAKQYGEEEFIKAHCPAGVSYADWVMNLRGGNNTVTFYTGDDFEARVEKLRRRP